MASMALLASRMALHSGRCLVTARGTSLKTLHARAVNNTIMNIRSSQLYCATGVPQYSIHVTSPHRLLTAVLSTQGHHDKSMSSVANNKVSMGQQVSRYLEMEEMNIPNSTHELARRSSAELSDIETLFSRYLITIAMEPVINPQNIVDIFELYARTGRPLVQDLHEYPDEFRKLAPVSEQALCRMSYADLQQLAKSLSFLRNQDLKIVHRLIKALCHECCYRVKNIPISEGIKYFEIVHHFHGTRQPFYAIFAEYFTLHIDEASEKELVKLMYYCTRKQKNSDSDFVHRALNRLEESLNSASLVTLGIVAESVAKSGLKLSSELPLLQKMILPLSARMREDKKWTDLEVYAVYSIVNLFRLSRFHNEDVIFMIERFLLTCEDSCLNAQTIPEFLAFLAGRSYHRDVFDRLEHLLVLDLKSNVSSVPTLQDFARILWSFSSTNHKCSDEFVSLVFANLHSFCALEHANNNFLKFVDALLSLAMMGHIDRHLTLRAFEPLNGRAKGYGGSGALFAKLVSRLTMLRQCLSIEAPDLSIPPLKTLAAPLELSQELQRRPALSMLFDQLKHLNELSPDGAVVFLARPINTIGVAGVCIDVASAARAVANIDDKYLDSIEGQLLVACSKLGSDVSIEVLDDTCTMNDVQQGSRSTGLVNFKIRLLKRLGWNSLIIEGDKISDELNSKKLLLDNLKTHV